MLGCADRAEPRDTFVLDRGTADGTDAGTGANAAPPFVRPGSPNWPTSDDVVTVPFGESASHEFTIEADVGKLDLHLSIDSTSSFEGEIRELRDRLSAVVIPDLEAKVTDVAYGVSRFEDFPLPPYGSPGDPAVGLRADRPFELMSGVGTSTSRVSSALQRLSESLGHGGDVPESGAEALWQIATGAGYTHAGTEYIAPFSQSPAHADGTIGGVGFRPGGLHVVLHITDAESHGPYPALPGTHSLEEAAQALRDINARLVAIHSVGSHSSGTRPESRRQLEYLAHATGAFIAAEEGVCQTGVRGAEISMYEGVCPLVFDINASGEGLSQTLVGGVLTLLDHVTFDLVQGQRADDPLGFIAGVEALAYGEGDDRVQPEDRLPEDAPDGIPDSFVTPARGTSLRFRIALRNDVIRPSAEPQRFRVAAEVYAGAVLLRRHQLAVLVPAGPTQRADADAGAP